MSKATGTLSASVHNSQEPCVTCARFHRVRGNAKSLAVAVAHLLAVHGIDVFSRADSWGTLTMADRAHAAAAECRWQATKQRGRALRHAFTACRSATIAATAI
jgi:hypothetical protein